MTGHIAAFLRYLADRIDHGGAPKYTHWSFTFETRRGLVFRDDGKGCPGAYLGDAAYERAHSEADSAASERDAGVNQKSRNPVMGASKQKPPVHMYSQCAGSVSINRQPVGHLDPAAYDILATYVPLDLPGFEHGDSLMFELRLVQVQNTPIADG